MCLRILRSFLLPVLFAIALVPPPAFAQSPSDAEIASLKQHGLELYQAGRFTDALPVAKQYAELIERRFGTAHPEYAIALFYIAEVLQANNRLAEAELLYREAFTIGEKTLGPDDPKIATVLGRLSTLYISQARYSEAEPLIKKQLLIREKALATDRTGLAATLLNLAHVYRLQARFSEAEPLMTRARGIYEEALGQNHPDLATSLSISRSCSRTLTVLSRPSLCCGARWR